jgi:hypothetical protein
MPRKRIEGGVAESTAVANARRVSNSAYMRRWRADAKCRESELARRMARYYERKARKAQRKQRLCSNDRRTAICAICLARPAVRQINRMRVSDSAPSGFEEVLMPYCGEC